ncbi:MAG: adenylate kinase [Fastidiosipilaceae bacterium]|jgi:adenylate kinase
MNLIILGPPGSGKGTLAANLREQLNVLHLSTGDLFRENISRGTELGKLASSYIDKGELVPDSVTIAMVKDALDSLPQGQGFLLDGFPRTVEQADALAEILRDSGKKLDAMIQTVLDDDIIVRRISGRRVCKNCGASYNVDEVPPKIENVCDRCAGSLEQRKDDSAATVHHRLETYHEKTKPLIDYYGKLGIILAVDTSGTPEESFSKACSLLDSMKIER